MSESLFRKEAIENQKKSLIGDVLLTHPASFRNFVMGISVVMLLIVSFLFWGTYVKRERVQGYLVPEKGVVRIYSQQHGIITSIKVLEGDNVNKGDSLLTFKAEKHSLDGQQIDKKILAELQRNRAYLTEQIRSQSSLVASKVDAQKISIQSSKRESETINEQIKVGEERIELLSRSMDKYKQLYSDGSVTVQDYEEKLSVLLDARERYAALKRQHVQVLNNIDAAVASLNAIKLGGDLKIANMNQQLSEIRQREIRLRGQFEFSVIAPLVGTVTTIQAVIGQTTLTNSPLLTILPSNSKLNAHLYVPARAIGFVKAGQTVNLRLSAFPYQRHGTQRGIIKEVSKVLLTPEELSVPLSLPEAVYRIVVELDKHEIEIGEEKIPLQPGMTLEADIILEEHYLIDWLLSPLRKMIG